MKVLQNKPTKLVLESRSRWIWPATNLILIPAGAIWVYLCFFNDAVDSVPLAIAIGLASATVHLFNLNVREELVLDRTAGACTHMRMRNGRVKQNTIPLGAIETAGLDTYHPLGNSKKVEHRIVLHVTEMSVPRASHLRLLYRRGAPPQIAVDALNAWLDSARPTA